MCEVLQHPSYNADNVDYDFSVLRLCEELQFQVIVFANLKTFKFRGAFTYPQFQAKDLFSI